MMVVAFSNVLISHVNHIVLRWCVESQARDSNPSALLFPLLHPFRRKKSPIFLRFLNFYKTAVLSYCLSSLRSSSEEEVLYTDPPPQTGNGTSFPLSSSSGEVSLELECSNGARSFTLQARSKVPGSIRKQVYPEPLMEYPTSGRCSSGVCPKHW